MCGMGIEGSKVSNLPWVVEGAGGRYLPGANPSMVLDRPHCQCLSSHGMSLMYCVDLESILPSPGDVSTLRYLRVYYSTYLHILTQSTRLPFIYH